SATFFDVMGVEPMLGRTFTTDENESGNTGVAVLGHALWQQRFGGDRSILGRTVQLDGESYQVVGVMPEGFDYPGGAEIWTPLAYGEGFRDDAQRGSYSLNVIGRRKPGVSVADANADIAAIGAKIARDFPGLKTGIGSVVFPMHDDLVGGIRLPLLILLGAVGFVLLIACVNVANLLLTRAAARESELAVRAALGAGRGRLVRQLLTESTLLGLLGGAFGLLLAVWGTNWLVRLRPEGIPRLEQVAVSWEVVGFTGLVALLTGILFGLVPAYQVTRGELIGSIREGGRGALRRRATTRVRGALVVVETALAVMLLAGAGLLIRSFVQLNAVDPGFRAERTLALDLALPSAYYPETEQVRAFYGELAERVEALPGVRSVGIVSALPLADFLQRTNLRIGGRPEPGPGEENSIDVRFASSGYLQTLGIPVLRGRGFTDQDRPGTLRVVLISETAARHYFPGEEAIGRRIELGMSRRGQPLGGEVVGIVGDVRNEGLSQDPPPMLYLSNDQTATRMASLVVRSHGEPRELMAAVRREVAAMDPNLPLFNIRTLEETLGEAISQPRFYMLLLSIFAGSALVLAAIGIFGVMSYAVVQRTREIGIRMALGADPRSVLRMVVGRALGLAALGVLLGLLGSLAGTRILSGLLFGVAPTDPLTLAGVATVLFGVAGIASYLPARAATRVDPNVALRYD
ncbi:MAG TPA: ABC transporter permease, partial [Longimicrobiaceae bacterium]|nr:ABC transporter permease [Longimicrobiaceae bacterium]